jgi:tight adherence protein B
MPWAFALISFLVIFALLMLVVSFGMKMIETQRKAKVGGILKTASGGPAAPESSILMDAPSDKGKASHEFFRRIPLVVSLDRQIQQSALDWTLTRLVVLTAIGVAAGIFLGTRIPIPVFREFATLAFATGLGCLPYVYVRMKRNKRLREFEEQFPEALDFLARSMRAGHAFSVSLEMLAEESPNPLGLEFRRLFHEQNLGTPIDVAMKNLTERVPLVDVRFFVSAVLLQRETGGNLAEILTKLSYVIRERFRLKGQVRAASAHGRITAMVLTALPIVTMLALMVVAPGYLRSMAEDPDGKYLIVGSIVGQMLGYYFMRRIINIKV